MNFRFLDVPAPKFPPIIRRQPGEALRESQPAVPGPTRSLNRARQVTEFVGAINLAVARENLLDQGGARARQPDDQDWRNVRVRRLLTVGNKFGCKRFDNTAVGFLGVDRVIGFEHASIPVAFLEV